MATTPNYLQNLVPVTYAADSDLEEFIKECKRFFEVSGTDQHLQGILM